MLASAVTGVGTGLIANYFSDTELNDLAITRVDPTVNFDWGQGSPDPKVPADGFGARWTGKVQAQYDETYTFYTTSDEGVALWVNGQQLIDNFTDHTLAEDSGTISLKAGELYDIRLDYYDNAFDASISLSWSSASTAKQIIPQSQLYGSAGWTSGGWLNNEVGNTSGSVSSDGSVYSIAGGGSGTSGSSDGFEYLYQTLEGDGTVVAKVNSTQGSSNGAEAGVMIRDSQNGSAAYASVVIDSLGRPSFESRASTGASMTTQQANTASGDYWIKIVRDGNFFRGYASSSGADNTWTYFGSTNISMGRTVFAGITSTSGTNGGQNTAKFQNVQVISTPPVGAGLEQVRDYSMGNPFVDIAKQARTFQGPNLGPNVATDANGWPLADFMTILLTGYANTAHLNNGTYHGSFTGQADIGTWLTPGGQIKNKSYDAGTNTTTFDFVVNASESADGWYAALQLTNTRRTPGDPLNTGITNLRVIRPGYDPNTTQVFQDSYLQHLKQFSTLRFMDWTQTNNSTVTNWSDRTTLASARQSSTSGVAWEYVVQLANQLHKDIWINIPVRATDDYVTQLATLLKNTLDPDRVVYVEYSNEVWNGIFSQYQDNLNAAVAEVNAGNSPLNADGETNQIYWSWRRTANRLKQVSDIFGNVWGQSAINGRVRPVLASQYANSLVVQQGLEFIERTYGAPSNYFYGIAEAPYIAMGSIDTTNPNLSVDDVISRLQGSADSNANRYYTYDTFARRYGLQNMAYEGGPDVSGSNNQAAKKAAMLDPRMEALVQSYLNGWYKAQGGLFNWFVGGPTVYSPTGMWGLSNLLDNWTAPKNLGTIDVATSQRTPLAWGQPAPAQFDARAIAGATVPYTTTYLKNSGKGKSFDYYIRAPKAGSYKIVFNAGTSDSAEQLRVAVGSDIRTLTLANTGSLTNFADNLVGTFQLAEGENLIHVTSVNEVAGWNIQTVTVAAGATPDGVPTVAIPAQASPTSINGTSTNLSVLGADDGGESNLVYSWQAVNEAPTGVSFSSNGTNAAKNTIATFTRAGKYTLKVTISDGVSTTTSSVVVNVNQIVTSISIAPTGTAIANGETKQLTATAKDQFGVQLYAQPSFTWSVTNGFGTISQTGLYQSPVSGLGTANISASAGGVTGTGTVITQSPRTADNPANAINAQLDYNYYQGSYTTVSNFDAATPLKSGLVNNFLTTPRQQSDNYAFQYQGFVYVPAAATYTFYVNSDDGSRLWIGTQLVVDNDGKHSAQEKTGQIILDQGWHQLKLDYFEATGGESLSVSYSGGGLAKQTIPDASLERVDRAPTVATPPTAIPNPVTNTQATLNVVGADESGESILSYTWSAVARPAGAANPTFSVNGTNASKNSIATFSKAGTYTLNVAISDGILTTNATVSVTVNATLTSIAISPQNPTVPQAHQQQFTASGFDQFGNTINGQAFNWSADVNGGSITSTGLYTAPSDGTGQFNVTASAGNVSQSTTVNVTADNAPTVVTPAAGNPNPVIGTQTQLSVLGDDDSGEANLTYTWTATTIPNGASAPTFSVNGTNASKNTTVTFTQAGTYTFTVTLFDGFKSTTSSVDVTVNLGSNNQAPVVVTPAAATPSTVTGNSTQLSVLGDDDGGEANLTYTWSVVGTPPANPTFGANGANAAKNTGVTFTKAGTYNFLVTISDGTFTTTSSVGVAVSQTLTSIALAPTGAFVTQGSTKQFGATALDQFGNALSNQPTFAWSVTSTGTGGTVSQSGLYTAPTGSTPTDTVIAGASGINGSATVAVVAGSSADAFGNDLDIGSPAIAGSYTVTGGGVYTVKASGADIFGNSDQFHYVYRTLSGDGQIIARVAAVQNTSTSAKAGVMFREDLTAGGRHVSLYIRPDNSASLQYRSTANLGTTIAATASASGAPYWVKLVRSGSTFTGYRSPDGASWVQIGGSIAITNMASTLYVGLALTSHNNAALNTSTFDNAVVQSAAALKGAVLSSAIKTPANAVGASSAPNALDGDLSTYFNATTASGNWVGVDFGSAKVITAIKYAPRSGYASRMIGGKLQASNTADFSKTTDLFAITSSPTSGKLTARRLSLGQAFRYVRYLAPGGSFGNIAEMAFVGF